ncbi:P-type conjugative transfer protein TrbJ [Sphingomonas sp. LaA6.9]|uniref:P-type conjugative transfer protein TrbJ n=1 Tax=Sphingomonas sp. LaA6.9 TaxID=2919914 RepID=UPI001F4FF308|nr:P-type conjugative transfer protein TrbJ [Sphingomonas sp. LaA6.9]MCJ8159163.1 P-type conjugative transfer protein TrbJ [Sphingomonas sp. LaA6.9]
MKKFILAALMASSATISMTMLAMVPVTPARAMPVFDSANYAQNLLIAARTLEQINQQIRSLQNEAAMLANMEKHLERIDFPELQQLRTKLAEIEALMDKAEGIDFRIGRIDDQFRKFFPQQFDRALRGDQHAGQAKDRLETAMAAFRQTMRVQAEVVGNVAEDAEALSAIVAKSQGAQGSLQAAQATNQLLALTAKQQFQIQQLMAAQSRADAIEQARRVQAESDARAATRKFLGSGTAYTPR